METKIPSKFTLAFFLFCVGFAYSRANQSETRMNLPLNLFLPEVAPWVYFFSNRLY